MRARRRIAILISGRGSNMEALITAAAGADFPAEIVTVISNHPDAAGLQIARGHGIETVAIPHHDHVDRAAHEVEIGRVLAECRPDIVCLAGYMRLLTPRFVATWEGRMINIHPSLLPAFPGLHTHRRALLQGVRVHGCTVHFVTEAMDDGPIIAQAAVPVLSGDTENSLAVRVLLAEHKLYPMALSMVARGEVSMRDGRAVFSGTGDGDPQTRLFSPALAEADPAEIADLEHLARFTP
ncbi:phosphoribosylglycinamide formyltransferase [Nitratireductor sp. CAU 1489]|uniref:Phosphoribosylglycinamide formyltransferase n=1 Tax=Nitratireductor arenosus TaxID=2682096 RepID=A0A844QQS1_9HYPH|nr:phosphoribosylglycinamide formyltransferase [Nitratireductor arenosus]MVB00152.1 phosphoribosylglycinamide formyltransferase [Nitratireductor arenosus]